MRTVLFCLLSMWACACYSHPRGIIVLTPEVACPGSTVHLRWAGGTEDSQVLVPGLGVVGTGPWGETSFACNFSGEVELIIPGYPTRRALVTAATTSQRYTADIHAGCGPQPALSGALGLSGTGLLTDAPGGAAATDPALRIEAVAADRPTLVFHDGAMARVEAVPVPFTGTLPGPYTVVSPLLEGEVCPGLGVTLRPGERFAPGHFNLTVQASCR